MLAAALTAYAELVGDTLVNTCGLPVPKRVLRYHGGPVPDDVGCEGDGILSVWWEYPMTPQEQRPNVPCPGLLDVTLAARWMTCWKVPTVTAQGITLFDATWDTRAAVLADAAECVARVLMRMDCTDVDPNEYVAAVKAGLRSPRLVDVSPVAPQGGIAGVLWRISGGLRAGETS